MILLLIFFFISMVALYNSRSPFLPKILLDDDPTPIFVTYLHIQYFIYLGCCLKTDVFYQVQATTLCFDVYNAPYSLSTLHQWRVHHNQSIAEWYMFSLQIPTSNNEIHHHTELSRH
jgi:hypothetical protein